MITLCHAAKGGSGTTVVACSRAIHSPRPTLLVDLCGDIPTMLGLGDPERAGVVDWLHSAAPPEHLDDLLIDVTPTCSLLPASTSYPVDGPPHEFLEHATLDRWQSLAVWLTQSAERSNGSVVIDAGTASLPGPFLERCTHRWLITRACYLSVRRATRLMHRQTGVVLVDEPGHGLKAADIARCIGAPVVATVPWDPTVPRAVDTGLLLTRRFPRNVRRALVRTAA